MSDLITDLFSALEAAGVSHAVWKSLERLEQALSGEDDIDLLVHPEQRETALDVLAGLGLVHDCRSPGNVGRDLLVYRGFDAHGFFFMVHVHFACRFGSKRHKEYRFPSETEMLETTRRVDGIPVLGEGYVLITRMLQAAVKGTQKDDHLRLMAKHFPSLPEAEIALVTTHLAHMLDADISVLLADVARQGPTALAPFAAKAADRLVHLQGTDIASPKPSLLRRLLRRRIGVNKLVSPLSIVLVGHDGTGKTTLSKLLVERLAPVAHARRIYLGRNVWSRPNRLIDTWRARRGMGLLGLLWPITSSLEILGRLVWGKFLTALGVAIIYDRSLADLVLKYHAKPLRESWFPLMLARVLSGKEARYAYLLVADPDAAATRKPGTDPRELARIHTFYLEQGHGRQVPLRTDEGSPEETCSRLLCNLMHRMVGRSSLTSHIRGDAS